MSCSCVAVTSDKGWRYELWIKVFGVPQSPIEDPWPQPLAGFGGQFCVKLDRARVTPGQLERLAEGIAAHWQMDRDLVYADIEEVGCPILVDPTVTIAGCRSHTALKLRGRWSIAG